MPIRTLLAAVLALVLAGCYESDINLLAETAARQPWSEDQEWTDAEGARFRIDRRSDGWYDYSVKTSPEADWATHAVLLNYLQTTNGYDIYVYVTYDDTERAYVYGLVVEGNGGWHSLKPDCESYVDLDAARRSGLEVADGASICRFDNTLRLLQAMRNVVAAPGFWGRVNS